MGGRPAGGAREARGGRDRRCGGIELCAVCREGAEQAAPLCRCSGNSRRLAAARRPTPALPSAASALPQVLARPHFLLATLLLCNSVAMEALPLFLDRLLNPVAAILLSGAGWTTDAGAAEGWCWCCRGLQAAAAGRVPPPPSSALRLPPAVTAILIAGEIAPQAVCKRYGLQVRRWAEGVERRWGRAAMASPTASCRPRTSPAGLACVPSLPCSLFSGSLHRASHQPPPRRHLSLIAPTLSPTINSAGGRLHGMVCAVPHAAHRAHHLAHRCAPHWVLQHQGARVLAVPCTCMPAPCPAWPTRQSSQAGLWARAARTACAPACSPLVLNRGSAAGSCCSGRCSPNTLWPHPH